MPAPKHIVALDAGHQLHADNETEPIGPGADETETKAKVTSGTVGSFSGVTEYDLNLSVALALRDELVSRGYIVVMIRESNDVSISNKERAELANAAGAEAFIRIHANYSSDPNVSGALALCQTENSPYPTCKALYGESRRLSDLVLDAYCKETGITKLPVWETDTMTGINFCEMPVTIVEMGYMSNEADDMKITKAGFDTIAAKGIADGIDAFFATDAQTTNQ